MKNILPIILLFGMIIPVMAQTDPSVSKKGSMKVRKTKPDSYTAVTDKAKEELDRAKAEADAKLKAEQNRLKAEADSKLKAEQDRLKKEVEQKAKDALKNKNKL